MLLKRRALILVGVVAVATHSVTGADGEPLRFRGAKIQDKKSGLIVEPMKAMNSLVLASTRHHYWLVLPYSESWTLTSTEQTPLVAKDDRYLVSLATVEGGVSDPRAHLDELLAKLEADESLMIRSAGVFEEKGRPVLRYQTQLRDAKGAEELWVWNYWTVATSTQAGIVFHMSIMDSSFSPERGEQLLRIFLGSLRADFEIKH